ncbi:MAG: hypothetical protein HY717_04195 [Planctomycetes bacterium]|nr:hypothetical protein [Planctomycetota bacterium]
MTLTSRLLNTFLCLCGSLFALAPADGAFEPVPYELLQGSFILDECRDCDRAPIRRPVRGTFVMTQLPVLFPGELYQITELKVQDAAGEYKASGSGELQVLFGNAAIQTLKLEVEVNGTGGIQLTSESVEAGLFWPPAFDLQAKDGSPQDPLHVYTLRLWAAPKAVKPVLYRLVQGIDNSSLTDECRPPCKRFTITVPIAGTFELGEIAANPLFTTYRLDNIDFYTPAGDRLYFVSGSGLYRWGGEVAVTQSMELECKVNDQPGTKFSSDPGIAGEPFPKIGIALTQFEPVILVVYSLKLLAEPSDQPPRTPFRRGDANGDGQADISDAVSILLWLFVGGEKPGCLEAADANGVDGHDISDAVYLLLYLFQAGPSPPEPGPENCGPAPKPAFACDQYPQC